MQDNVDEDEKREIFTRLEKYCELDTLGMIWILDKLDSLVRG